MRIYRAVWLAACVMFVVVGIAIAIIVIPFSVWGVFAVPIAVTGVLLTITSGEDQARLRGRRVVGAMAKGYCVLMAALGLTAVIGGSVVLLLGFLTAVSPRAIAWYADRHGSVDLERFETPTAALCREWLETYDALLHATSSAARLRIVMKRQRCLDELERRDPQGVQAWLASTASAGGDPRRFLSGGSSG